MGQRGEGGQGVCRKLPGGGQGQGLGRENACRFQPVNGKDMSVNPAAVQKSRAENGSGRETDPNQQALDEIMDAVRQMEMRPKGQR